MKSLHHKVIIYDDVCPLCKAYTNGFVQLGWLLPEHRIGFSEATPAMLAQLDINRARHEIPLLDTVTGEVLYGKEALFCILGTVFPWLKPLFRWVVFRWVIYGLYQIITYNRRIIAGSRKPETGFDCAPDFHPFYRWLYIVLVTAVAIALNLKAVSAAPVAQHWGLAALGVLSLAWGFRWQGVEARTTYFGHWATVLLMVGVGMAVVGWSGFGIVVLLPLGGYWLGKRVGLVA